jgi:hypothetical protein
VYECVILADFEDIREQLGTSEDSVHAYLEYVERTWIGRRLGRTTKKPLFPIAAWNHHNSLLTGTHKRHPSIYFSTPELMAENL